MGELKLDGKYIEKLEEFECIPILKYNPTRKQLSAIHGKIWSLDDVKKYILDNPNECVSIFKGIVLHMADYPPSWKHMVNGRDITMMYAKRWAHGNAVNCESMNSLEDDQKVYVNGE